MSKPKRLDEEFARTAVTRFLCPPFRQDELTWQPSEAPDWHLNLAGRQLGLEVTWVSGTTNLGGRTVPNKKVSTSLASWVTELARDLKGKPWLQGRYIVSMRPIPNLRARTSELRDQIVEYIRSTRDQVTAPSRPLTGGWRIRKYTGNAPQLSYSCTLGNGGSESEIVAEAEQLISDAVRRKTSLLATSSMPIALVLIDDYHFAPLPTWIATAKRSEFHSAYTILRVHGKYLCDHLAGRDLRDLKTLAD